MKVILAICILTASWVCYAMEVKLPAEDELNRTLSDLNLEYFNKKAQVAKKLGDITCTPLHLVIKIDQMVEDLRIFWRDDE